MSDTRTPLRSLTRPEAILWHLLVLGVVGVLVSFGQWQLERLDQVRTANARLEERASREPVDLRVLLEEVGPDPLALEFRRVSVVGVFRPEEEVLQRNRIQRGLQGLDVLTPLDLGDGTTLLVRRGWVPTTMDRPPVEEASPPSGAVTVTGILERSVEQPSFGARDADEGVLQRVFHPDTSRLDRQMSGALLPVVLRMDALPGTGTTALPAPPDPPGLDEGSHLSYAAQWHLFAVLAMVAYAFWWRARLRRTERPTEERDLPAGA
jgi:cytochrome oxidase assembly protein ShyY1